MLLLHQTHFKTNHFVDDLLQHVSRLTITKKPMVEKTIWKY